jgi:uncharacterized tellurite resistance protein B-like protein
MTDATTMFSNGVATAAEAGADVATGAAIPSLGGEARARKPGGWFPKLVGYYLRRNAARLKAAPAEAVAGASASDQALKAIRWACVKSAITGATAGAISTGAAVFTAETEGLGGIIAGPVAALAIGGEMILRVVLHVGLSCELASTFGVPFDPDDQDDLWRLYALVFKTHGHEEGSEDPGKELVHEVTHLEGEQVAEQIGQRVLGESVMRNIVPFVGIFTSAYTNYRTTKRLGDTLRRYMRYQRAMDDVRAQALAVCNANVDLLIEGMWFIFSADGRLDPEETAFLAHMLKRLEPMQRHAVIARFVEDELDWTERIAVEVPVEQRRTFYHALEVAAAVDKEVGLPERKILRRVAHAFGIEFSQERIEKMIAEFEESGILREHQHPAR